MTLICTRGLQASGKTTWALELVDALDPGAAVRLNRDDLRWSMHGRLHFKSFTEQQVTLVQHGGVDALLATGVTVIVDDTNLRARHLRTLAEIAWRNEVPFEVKDFTHIPLEECIARDLGREGSRGYVGEDVIRRTHDKFLRGRRLPLPVPERPAVVTAAPYVPPAGKLRAVMVDVDGTLALHGDRDPYDPTRYDEDLPNSGVVAMVCAASAYGHVVLYCSGRSEAYREVTADWIGRHIGHRPDTEHLVMRPAGDTRNDAVVKLELFDKYIRHEYQIDCVFDDRDRVVKAWRGIGLTVMQVADGRF